MAFYFAFPAITKFNALFIRPSLFRKRSTSFFILSGIRNQRNGFIANCRFTEGENAHLHLFFHLIQNILHIRNPASAESLKSSSVQHIRSLSGALADALLHPQDRAYSVPKLFNFLLFRVIGKLSLSPSLIRIKSIHILGDLFCIWAKVFLINHAIVVSHKSHHSGISVLRRV